MTEEGINLNSNIQSVLKAVKTVVAQQQSNNPYVDPDSVQISDRIARRIANQAGVTSVKADVKSEARGEGTNNLRNPLSLCGVLEAVLEKVDPRLILSVDDVSILLNAMGEKPTVLTTKEATRILKEHQLSVSTTRNTKKQRILTFSGQMFSTGESFTIVKYPDRNFPDYMKKQPKMYRGVGDGSNIYYMYCHPEINPVDLAFYQYENIIVPHAIEVRNRLIEEDVKGFVGAEIIPSSTESEDPLDLSASYASINESHPSREEVEKRLEWICIAQDGAIEYLEAVMSRLQYSNETHGRSIINIKYAAGCSLSESPNDTGTMHMCLQGPACYGGDNFKYGEFTEPEGVFFVEMRQWLEGALEKSDFDAVWPAIHKASQYLPKAFNHMSCKNAFTQGGIVPYNKNKILSKFNC